MKRPKITVFSVPSGGSGKTTLSANGAYYVANKKNKKTLLVDLDQSCSLTDRMLKRFAENSNIDYKELYDKVESEENETYTVRAIFEGRTPTPLIIDDNLDFISGFSLLTLMANSVKNEFSWKAIEMWLNRNAEELSQYDEIILDTHNDEVTNIFLTSAYYVADKIVVVVPVDETVLKKVDEIQNRVDRLKEIEGTEKVKAKVLVVGNKFLASPSIEEKQFQKQFYSLIESEPDVYIGYFANRKYFLGFKANGNVLVEQEKKRHGMKQSDKLFFKKTWALYDKIFE